MAVLLEDESLRDGLQFEQKALPLADKLELAAKTAEGRYALDFSPPLSADKREAIERLPMGAMQKVIMTFKRDISAGARANSWVLYKDDRTGNIMAFVIKPLEANMAIGFFGDYSSLHGGKRGIAARGERFAKKRG